MPLLHRQTPPSSPVVIPIPPHLLLNASNLSASAVNSSTGDFGGGVNVDDPPTPELVDGVYGGGVILGTDGGSLVVALLLVAAALEVRDDPFVSSSLPSTPLFELAFTVTPSTLVSEGTSSSVGGMSGKTGFLASGISSGCSKTPFGIAS